MKAFVASIIAIVVIAAAAAIALQFVPMSSSDVFTSAPNVRL